MANYILNCTGSELDKAVNLIKNQVAPLFSDALAYTQGDVVIYDGILYSAKVSMGAGAWVANNWEATKIFDSNGYLILDAT